MRSAAPTVLQGGQELTVEWTEVIDHESHYRVALLLDGESFQVPTNQNDTCDPASESWCIADSLPDETGSMNTYSYTFTVPNVDCDNCTLQVLQNTFVRYFQCADIIIEAQPDDGDPNDPDPIGSGGTNSSTGGNGTGSSANSSGGSASGGDPLVPGTGTGGTVDDGSQPDGNDDLGDEASDDTGGCSVAPGAQHRSFWSLMVPLLWMMRRRLRTRRM